MLKVTSQFREQLLKQARKMAKNNFNFKLNFQSIKALLIGSISVIAIAVACLLYECFQVREMLADKMIKVYQLENSLMSSSSIAALQDFEDSLMIINRTNNHEILVLFVLAFVVVILCIVLGIAFHKEKKNLETPIYLMAQQMQEMIAGTLPETEDLEQQNAFSEFYDLFREMVAVSRKREEEIEFLKFKLNKLEHKEKEKNKEKDKAKDHIYHFLNRNRGQR